MSQVENHHLHKLTEDLSKERKDINYHHSMDGEYLNAEDYSTSALIPQYRLAVVK